MDETTEKVLDALLYAGLGLLLLLFPLLYGWIPIDVGGDTTLSPSFPVAVLEILAGFLALVLGARMALTPRTSQARHGGTALTILGLAFLGLAALQLLPLPVGLHAFLSPKGSDLLDRFGGADAMTARPLSLLPGGSAVALVKITAFFVIFLAARALPRSRRDFHRFFTAVAVLGGVIAALGLLKSSAPDALSFLFPKGGAGERAAGPFLNANHFAGYLEMCFPIALAAFILAGPFPALKGLDRAALGDFLQKNGGKKALAGFSCLLMAGAIIASLSRLGIFSFLLSLCVFFFLLYRGRGRKALFGLILFLSFAVVFIVSVYVGLDPVLERYSLLEDAGVNRIDAWKMGLDIVGDFPLTGSGTGTFRFLSPLYQPAALKGGFHQTHNDYINLAADMGLPALLLGLSFLGLWFRSTSVSYTHLRAHET